MGKINSKLLQNIGPVQAIHIMFCNEDDISAKMKENHNELWESVKQKWENRKNNGKIKPIGVRKFSYF